ncbi:MAG: peptidoglycan -binding protein [Paracoccaceae bacterium]|jgi:chemotaxis protein MotB|nr:peptidoglycan -binding protein [Paracoccaceae bacterium]
MGRARRGSGREPLSIWPGFVDAFTTLLLLLMFVLTIFLLAQFVLRDTITSQETKMSGLADQVSALADALGLERRETARLSGELDSAQDTARKQDQLIATLGAQVSAQSTELDAAGAEITRFEAQVAGLLAQRTTLNTALNDRQTQIEALTSTQEALNLALAQSRSEIDAQTEAARLDAARRAALEALIEDLKRDAGAKETALVELQSSLKAVRDDKLAEAAAAALLREKLQNANSELTAMTLMLEDKRKAAEDTLTLLAAAQAARADLQAQVDANQATALTESERQAALLSVANRRLQDQQAKSAEAERQLALLNEQTAALRQQLGQLQTLLDISAENDAQAQVQITALGNQLNQALASTASEQRKRADLEEAERKRLEQVASLQEKLNVALKIAADEQRQRADLEEAERKRLEAEAKKLERYRSDFFGTLRDLMAELEGVRVVGDRFVFSSEVLFEPGQTDLTAAGQEQIKDVFARLRPVLDRIPPQIDWVIRVDGHTDNIPLLGTGAFVNNWQLSQARALSVVLFMIDRLGFPAERAAATGFGEYHPVAPENTPEARAQNRRIELKLTER